jgi:hypothetical protein
MTLSIASGQTGTLTLKADPTVTLPVQIMSYPYNDWLDIKIPGTSVSNAVRIAEWTFTPDPEPLPTRVGSCVRSGSIIASRIVSADSGKHWRVMNGDGRWLSDDELPNPVVLFDAGTVLK